MKPFNRRKFVGLLAVGSAGGTLIPAYLRSGQGPTSPGQPQPMLPYVSVEASYLIAFDRNGNLLTPVPPGFPGGMLAINQTPMGGINTIYPRGVPPAIYQEAFDRYATENPPKGFVPGGAVPQFALLEIIIAGVVLIAGGYVVYKLYKWASQLPPPDTNVYR